MTTPHYPFAGGRLGATVQADGTTRFLVWAPNAQSVDLLIEGDAPRTVPMQPEPPRPDAGYYSLTLPDAPPGTLYRYRLDGGDAWPDPASRHQPGGVHGSSAVPQPLDAPDPSWTGVPLEDFITYELHVGTFSPGGTFEGLIERLDMLVELGVTAIEIMPVAEFPGARNWGYDGVYPFAAHSAYGGAPGLQRLVEACHARGLAVVLDVVYNHLGPEGNYLSQFGPYFTSRYHTPWGDAINFDGPGGDEVRRYFIENALYWTIEMGIDALRLDAVHAIYDFSATPFLQELAGTVHAAARRAGRHVYLIAESDQNDPRLVRPAEAGGWGLDGVWSDSMHHALHTMLTGESEGYYGDYGTMAELAKSWRDSFVHDGCYSRLRKRRHGAPMHGVAAHRFVVCGQNHDQTGNRLYGERIGALVGFGAQKLMAAQVLLSPYQPLLFMGEEYAEPAPFQFFVSHGDEGLIEAVRRGRREEFAHFNWTEEPPDPQAESTFRRSRPNPDLRQGGRHKAMWEYYKALIALRRSQPALATPDNKAMQVFESPAAGTLGVVRRHRDQVALLVFNMAAEPAVLTLPTEGVAWQKALDSQAAPFDDGEGELPARLEPAAEIRLELAGHQAAVYLGVPAGGEPS